MIYASPTPLIHIFKIVLSTFNIVSNQKVCKKIWHQKRHVDTKKLPGPSCKKTILDIHVACSRAIEFGVILSIGLCHFFALKMFSKYELELGELNKIKKDNGLR